MNSIFKLYPNSGTHSSQGDGMELYKAIFDKSSNADTALNLTIRELVQNSLDPIDENDDIDKTKVLITLRKLTYDFIDISSLKEQINNCIEEVKQIKPDDYMSDKTFKSLINISKKITSDPFQSHTLIIEDESGGLTGKSRSEKELGLAALVDSARSTKSKGGGSHGVGKTTAFNLSSLNCVFYLNQHKNQKKFIGKLIASTYKDNVDPRINHGPEYFFGEPQQINDLVFSDYGLADNINPKLKTLKGDGLSTIIPVDDIKNPVEWKDRVVFSVISNYYNNFLQNNLEVEVIDEIKNTKTIINEKSIKDVLIALESKEFLREEYLDDYHHYHLIKNQILNFDNPCEKIEFKIEFEEQKCKKYNSECIIKFYKNDELDNIAENKDCKNYMRQNFRLLRKNTLIRSHYLPGGPKRATSLSSYAYSGVITFKGDINKIIRDLETQSHDTLDLENLSYEPDYPNIQAFKKKVFTRINKEIVNAVDKLSGNDFEEGEEFDIQFDSPFGENSENNSPTYKRKLFDDDDFKRLLENSNNINERNKGNISSNSQIFGDITKEGNTVFIRRRSGAPNPQPVPTSPNPKPEIVSSHLGTQSNRAEYKIKNNQKLGGLEFKSFLIEQKGKNHKYKMVISGLESCNSIEILQDSIVNDSFLSVDLKKITVNGKELDKNEVEIKYTENIPKSITLKNIEGENKKIVLLMDVEEIENTVSEFKLHIK